MPLLNEGNKLINTSSCSQTNPPRSTDRCIRHASYFLSQRCRAETPPLPDALSSSVLTGRTGDGPETAHSPSNQPFVPP